MMSRGSNEAKVLHLFAVLCLAGLARLEGQENAPPGLEFHRITFPDGRIDEVGGDFCPSIVTRSRKRLPS